LIGVFASEIVSEIAGLSAIHRDMTEQRRAFEVAQHMAAIVGNSEDAIIGKTLECTITSWNLAAERMYGWAKSEIIGKDLLHTIIPSFYRKGFANGGEKIFRDYLATHYHRPSDQMDLPFNWDAAAKFAKLNDLIAREIANQPAKPLWYRDSLFGITYAPKATKANR